MMWEVGGPSGIVLGLYSATLRVPKNFEGGGAWVWLGVYAVQPETRLCTFYPDLSLISWIFKIYFSLILSINLNYLSSGFSLYMKDPKHERGTK